MTPLKFSNLVERNLHHKFTISPLVTVKYDGTRHLSDAVFVTIFRKGDKFDCDNYTEISRERYKMLDQFSGSGSIHGENMERSRFESGSFFTPAC